MNSLAQNTTDFSQSFGQTTAAQPDIGGFVVFIVIFYVVIIIIAIVDIILKVKAMWRAARLSDKGWFICLFIFNTAGILPFIYLRKNKDRYRELILKKHKD